MPHSNKMKSISNSNAPLTLRSVRQRHSYEGISFRKLYIYTYKLYILYTPRHDHYCAGSIILYNDEIILFHFASVFNKYSIYLSIILLFILNIELNERVLSKLIFLYKIYKLMFFISQMYYVYIKKPKKQIIGLVYLRVCFTPLTNFWNRNRFACLMIRYLKNILTTSENAKSMIQNKNLTP